MAPIPVLAPLAGRVVAMSDVPDEVFADGLVGPGCAIDPLADADADVTPGGPSDVAALSVEALDDAGGADAATGSAVPSPATVVACAPIAGRVVKLFPHAFAIIGEHEGVPVAVLVHLGIDTVRLHGDGFELLADEGDQVEVGAPITEWSPAAALAAGYSPLVPVLALDTKPERLAFLAEPGASVQAGEGLFEIEPPPQGVGGIYARA